RRRRRGASTRPGRCPVFRSRCRSSGRCTSPFSARPRRRRSRPRCYHGGGTAGATAKLRLRDTAGIVEPIRPVTASPQEVLMPEAVIVEAVRSPVGRKNGKLAAVRPDDLAANVLRTLVERARIEPELVEDVIFGCVDQLGEQGFNIA